LKAEGVHFMQGFYYGRPQIGRPGSKMPKRHVAQVMAKEAKQADIVSAAD